MDEFSTAVLRLTFQSDVKAANWSMKSLGGKIIKTLFTFKMLANVNSDHPFLIKLIFTVDLSSANA